MRKLKSAEVKGTRESMLVQQGNVCAMCKQPLTPGDAVLDHNHVTGAVRGVAHRGCNSLEGKIVNAVKRFGVRDLKALLTGLVEYHNLHSTNQTQLLHPTFFTEEEKKAKAAKRRKKIKNASKT